MTTPGERDLGAHASPVPPGPPGGEDFIAWNEAMVQRYDIERYYERSHLAIRWLERRRLDVMVRLAALRRSDRVLEVGCGAGHVLERFDGHARTGIDLSTGMIARARRRLGARVGLIRAAGEHLPFAAGSFDVVVCTEVLEHVPEPAGIIAELARVAGPAGRIVISIPNEANIDRAKRLMRRLPVLRGLLHALAAEENEWHLHRFDLDFLRRVVQGRAAIIRTVAIPSRAMPLRYAALLRATGPHRQAP